MNNTEAYRLSVQDILKELSTNLKGLSVSEAKERLTKNGLNKIESFKSKSALEVFIGQFSSFLVWLLIAADLGSGFIWLRTGRQEFLLNFLVITFIIIVNASLGFFQEFQAQRHADNLRRMLQVKAKVLRQGEEEEIDAQELVVGDVIILGEGDKVPADARLIEANNFNVDESSLTGESNPVEKTADVINEEKPLAERVNMVYGQTFVVKGEAKAIIMTTGMQTEVGKIFSSLNKTKEQKTPFEMELDKVGKKIAFAIGIVIVFIGALLIYHHMPFATVFIIAVSLAVGAIPEGLPAITTFVLALGSQRMLKDKFLVKKLSSIESLGSIDVIATDKTGTLTQNKMSIERVFLGNHDIDLSQDKHLSALINHEIADTFLHTIVLANEVEIDKNGDLKGDPTETALLDLARINGLDPKRIKSENKRLDLMPFSSDTKFSASLYDVQEENILFLTGAPEIVLEKCSLCNFEGKDTEMTSDVRERILQKTEDFSRNALRVIAIAKKVTKDDKIGDIKDLSFISLIGLKDPPRPEVKDAILQAKSAGIKLIMLTGDYKLTAKAIAEEIGFPGSEAVDATDIKGVSDEEFAKLVEKVDIFSRMDPEFKLRILSALQKNGHRVAMTGDGVNDAPALKKADISLAMGIRGTDLAKEVSHVILLDDNFATIIRGIKEGRTIFHNLRKFVNYILTANVAEVMVIFVTSLFGFVPLTATQILWTNFITDVFPAMSLGVDAPPKDIMLQKPRGVKEHVLNKRLLALTFGIGTKKSVIMLIVFALGMRIWNLQVAQTLTFTWLVFSHFIRIASIRVNEGVPFFINKYVNLSIFTSSGLQFVILYSPMNIFFNAVSLSVYQLLFDGFWLFIVGLPLAILITELIARFIPDD